MVGCDHRVRVWLVHCEWSHKREFLGPVNQGTRPGAKSIVSNARRDRWIARRQTSLKRRPNGTIGRREGHLRPSIQSRDAMTPVEAWASTPHKGKVSRAANFIPDARKIFSQRHGDADIGRFFPWCRWGLCPKARISPGFCPRPNPSVCCGAAKSGLGQKPRPSRPRHVSFRRLRTLVRASIRWSSRPTLLRPGSARIAPHGRGRICSGTPGQRAHVCARLEGGGERKARPRFRAAHYRV
jgi:hypothetical protein